MKKLIARTSEMRRDVIALSARSATVLPFAGEAQIAGALAADVLIAQVVVERLGVRQHLVAVDPLAGMAGFLLGVVVRRLVGGLLVLRVGVW